MVSWLLWCTNIKIAKSNAIHDALDWLKSPISHIQGHKKVNPDKVLVLIKSSLWQSTEVRTLSGFYCIKSCHSLHYSWVGQKKIFKGQRGLIYHLLALTTCTHIYVSKKCSYVRERLWKYSDSVLYLLRNMARTCTWKCNRKKSQITTAMVCVFLRD